MIKNIIHFTFDGLGTCLKKTGVFKGRSNNIDVVQVLSPMPPMALGVNFKLFNSTMTEYNQFMSVTGEKGKDVLDPADELYQRCYDWNVWEVEVKENVLMDITFFRSGRLALSFKWRAFAPSSNCVEYQGIFGASYPVPVGTNPGDWWYCEGQYYFAGIEFGDKTIMYFDGTDYKMDAYTEELPTLPQTMPVDKNFSVQSFTSSEQLELTEIKMDIADLEQAVAQLEGGAGMKLFENIAEANAANLPAGKLAFVKKEN